MRQVGVQHVVAAVRLDSNLAALRQTWPIGDSHGCFSKADTREKYPWSVPKYSKSSLLSMVSVLL